LIGNDIIDRQHHHPEKFKSLKMSSATIILTLKQDQYVGDSSQQFLCVF